MAVHIKARSSPYQGGPERFPVPDSKVDWKVKFIEYAPVEYTAPSVKAQPVWADNPAEIRSLKFNALDGKINRKSHEGEYVLESATGLPLNPHGRTGMTGRGLLGRFGPNHAADPIVTRWKRQDGQEVRDSRGNKVLEFVGIKRKDTGEWALPGGMVDAGENVSLTLKREFGEEALNTLELSPSDRKLALHQIEQLFASGVEMYKGYVDDPRNTDNAWMETVAMNFHDDTGELTSHFKLHAGDDAGAVSWIAVSPDIKLYASHADFIRRLASYMTVDGQAPSPSLHPDDAALTEEELHVALSNLNVACRATEARLQDIQAIRKSCRSLFAAIEDDVKSICFLIDVSGSMYRTLSFVQSELVRTLASLPLTSSFNCIAFSADVVPWSSTCVRMTPDNLESICIWVRALCPQSSTDTLGALRRALADRAVTSLCLLTDGLPDSGPAAIMHALPAMLAGRTVRIHTISFNCDNTLANDFLRSIATSTNGSYTLFTADDISHSIAAHTDTLVREERMLQAEAEALETRRAACRAAIMHKQSVREEEDRAAAVRRKFVGMRVLVHSGPARWLTGTIQDVLPDDEFIVHQRLDGRAVRLHLTDLRALVPLTTAAAGDYVLIDAGSEYTPGVVLSTADCHPGHCSVQRPNESPYAVPFSMLVASTFDEYAEAADALQSLLLEAAERDERLLAGSNVGYDATGTLTSTGPGGKGGVTFASKDGTAGKDRVRARTVGPSRYSQQTLDQKAAEVAQAQRDLILLKEAEQRNARDGTRRLQRMERDAKAYLAQTDKQAQRDASRTQRLREHEERVGVSTARQAAFEEKIEDSLRTLRHEKAAIERAAAARSSKAAAFTEKKIDSMRAREAARRAAHVRGEDEALSQDAETVAARRAVVLARQAAIATRRDEEHSQNQEENARMLEAALAKHKHASERHETAAAKWDERQEYRAKTTQAQLALEKEREDHAIRAEERKVIQGAARARLKEQEDREKQLQEFEQAKRGVSHGVVRTQERLHKERTREDAAFAAAVASMDARRAAGAARTTTSVSSSTSAQETAVARENHQRQVRIEREAAARAKADQLFEQQQKHIDTRRQRLVGMDQARLAAADDAHQREEQQLAARRARSASSTTAKLVQSRGQQAWEAAAESVIKQAEAHAGATLFTRPW
eukprot:m.139406 g.139406  ORF g.139406 m.139406 type:complete len:1160 (-) comp14934_c4_seq26:374-3853(-)